MSFLRIACKHAMERVKSGYYNIACTNKVSRSSLKKSLSGDVCLICELKPMSPSKGVIKKVDDPLGIVRQMLDAGADAISILTDPENFGGSINTLVNVSTSIENPVLMKDFVVSYEQIDAAYRAGASAVLLIYPVFKRGYSSIELEDAIVAARSLGLEVILEVYEEDGLEDAMGYDVEFIGANSRNLDTLDVNLERALELIGKIPEKDRSRIIAESGIKGWEDVAIFLRHGVNKFLVGTAIMASGDIGSKIRELKGAGRWFG